VVGVVTEARAVGRLAGGRWVGFVPGPDGRYRLAVGDGTEAAASPADDDDLLALAIAYFEDSLGEPPEDLAATHADIGALVRQVMLGGRDADRRPALQEAMDAIDDGLAADVVIARLVRCLTGTEEPAARLVRRANRLAEGRAG
jgi:hypothetical protein